MKESIRVEDRSLKIYDSNYKTDCGITVQTAKIYDAKNGEPLMEDITLTDFSEFTKE
jgi:hypothetical protein